MKFHIRFENLLEIELFAVNFLEEIWYPISARAVRRKDEWSTISSLMRLKIRFFIRYKKNKR